MNTENKHQETQPAAGIARRSFIKKAAGTVLFFGIASAAKAGENVGPDGGVLTHCVNPTGTGFMSRSHESRECTVYGDQVLPAGASCASAGVAAGCEYYDDVDCFNWEISQQLPFAVGHGASAKCYW